MIRRYERCNPRRCAFCAFRRSGSFGIYDGYLGLYEDRMEQLDRYSVSDMINRGGTFLGSARFPEFRDENVRAKAIENLKNRGIDALVVIGGDGSYMGAKRLTKASRASVCRAPSITTLPAPTTPSVTSPRWKPWWKRSTACAIPLFAPAYLHRGSDGPLLRRSDAGGDCRRLRIHRAA